MLIAAINMAMNDIPTRTTAVASSQILPDTPLYDELKTELEAAGGSKDLFSTGMPVTLDQLDNGEVYVPDSFIASMGETFDGDPFEMVGDRKDAGDGLQVGMTGRFTLAGMPPEMRNDPDVQAFFNHMNSLKNNE